MMGGEGARDSHAVGFGELDELAHGVGRIDDDRFPALAITDEVREVDHLRRHRVVTGEVAPGQELAEVEAILAHDVDGTVRAAGL
jgi:hypothetical protein